MTVVKGNFFECFSTPEIPDAKTLTEQRRASFEKTLPYISVYIFHSSFAQVYKSSLSSRCISHDDDLSRKEKLKFQRHALICDFFFLMYIFQVGQKRTQSVYIFRISIFKSFLPRRNRFLFLSESPRFCDFSG